MIEMSHPIFSFTEQQINDIKNRLSHIQTRITDDEEDPELEALILRETIMIWRILKEHA